MGQWPRWRAGRLAAEPGSATTNEANDGTPQESHDNVVPPWLASRCRGDAHDHATKCRCWHVPSRAARNTRWRPQDTFPWRGYRSPALRRSSETTEGPDCEAFMPSRFRKMCRTRVVLPAPRNPQRMVTGTCGEWYGERVRKHD